MEDRSDVEQQPPARWASPALPSTARQQRDSWPESPGRYGPPHEQHYFATAPTRSQPIHHPPAHPYYPSPGPYSPARQSAPASMYRLPPPPSPPLPASLSSSAPPGSGTYYNSNPVPPPASYDWSAPLPPIRLAPPRIPPTTETVPLRCTLPTFILPLSSPPFSLPSVDQLPPPGPRLERASDRSTATALASVPAAPSSNGSLKTATRALASASRSSSTRACRR
ncbi:hypothetical protein BCR35DRAFT_8105 [Leucosporidium creatinivorum]|uniref:Uncharacterized protein n=1 Tax=Leucosporidium creatinivorum TaxID=106004 RepID=A0A1Y2G4A9_9BASI|nr:hypothetical protein BCR35DRAFT_8105 [Leucosporidium creatinivorum]